MGLFGKGQRHRFSDLPEDRGTARRPDLGGVGVGARRRLQVHDSAQAVNGGQSLAQSSKPPTRRAATEFAEIPNEMRLVVISALAATAAQSIPPRPSDDARRK